MDATTPFCHATAAAASLASARVISATGEVTGGDTVTFTAQAMSSEQIIDNRVANTMTQMTKTGRASASRQLPT